MQSLSRRKKIEENETLIKESLLQQLSYAIKEIQLIISKKEEVFSTSEECNSLIVVIEAIFLHGLKKGILKTALKTVSGSDDTKPSPSFWSAVSGYTHKTTIATIRKLSQIKTDVGRCRVWVRMALNEGELTSYFTAMEKDRRGLNSSYSNHAFLRDRENCDTACKLLGGIQTVQFEVPVNSSILNTWSTEPLLLSGVWLPAMKTPLSTGVDVAEKIEDDDDFDDSCSIKTTSSITTISTILALDETQALKMILETPVKKLNENMNIPSPSASKPECDLILEEEEPEETKNKEQPQLICGNSLLNAKGWSSADQISPLPEIPQNTLPEIPQNTLPEIPQNTLPEIKAEDYDTLLENVGISPSKVNYEAKLKEVMQRHNSDDQKSSPITKSNDSNYNSYTCKLYKIVREASLKAQKYTCAGCQLSIGLTFGDARLCYYTGQHYCDDCHLYDFRVIPSRLLFNWDHRKYPVCKNVNIYLDDICSRLLIDVKKVNPKLYFAVKEMKDLKGIRIQLNILRAYFITCQEPVLSVLQKKISSREYLYEFIDHYSINDLCRVPNGVLAEELNLIVEYGRDHVINCWFCSQKGFICEVCKNMEIIYPFDLSTTYRCGKCYSIYHKNCLSTSKNCPKCKRLKKRTLSQSHEDEQQEVLNQ